ncbi:hypothetical protein WJX84_001129 [Apatococcus fuscideae]|uniref:Guanylate cyclase domain-containing protein n=1 Tax=Apatococcus fuscideae TaxID=2026836 RepID=A0AAW1SHZ1_9CHLO
MVCESDVHVSLALPVALPVGLLGGLIFIVLITFACVYKRVFRELEANRIARTQRKELTLCMTDVAGSTALWEWDAVVMNKALAIQEECLRGLLPRHFGHEIYTEGDAFLLSFHDPLDGVRFVIDLQKELLKLTWPAELLQRPQAASISVPGPNGDCLIFAGLRLRAVLHTGWPTSIETHQTTRHISYSGPMVELTEALTALPSGGQCIMSGQTYQRAFPQLQALAALAEDSQRKGRAEARTRWTAVARLAWSRMLGMRSGRPHKLESQQLPTAGTSQASLDGLGVQQIAASSSAGRAAHEALPKSMADTPALDDSDLSLTFLDMGSWRFHGFSDSELRESAPGSAALQGLQIMQMLPSGLLIRAQHFDRFSGGQQVMPSFLEAPGSRMATFLRPHQHAELSNPLKANVVVAFCSPCRTGEGQDILAQAALHQYQSCIRTSLLLLGGYECQEMHGTFMLAFHSSRAAAEWAISAQLCLLRLSSSSGSETVSDHLGRTRALVARIGIAEGPMIKICPHKATGRADYFGQAVNRAARLREAAGPGQIVVEGTMLETLVAQWDGSLEPEALSGPSQQLAIENFCRLTDCKGVPDRRCSMQETSGPTGTIVRVLHKTNSKIKLRLPTTGVNLNATLLGTYLLKGIPGNHSIWRIMPQQLEARLAQTSKHSSVQKLPRGHIVRRYEMRGLTGEARLACSSLRTGGGSSNFGFAVSGRSTCSLCAYTTGLHISSKVCSAHSSS